MYFDEETGKWEKFGTSPVSDAYFKLCDEELRELLVSSASSIKEVPPEEDGALWFEMKEGEITQVSKGMRDFLNYRNKERLDRQ